MMLKKISAVVEIFVEEDAKARYTTVQNWSKDVYNLNTKRAVVDAEGYRRLSDAELEPMVQAMVEQRRQRPDGPAAAIPEEGRS